MKRYSGWYREVLIPAGGITHGDPVWNEATLVTNDQDGSFVGFFPFLMCSDTGSHIVPTRTSEESMTFYAHHIHREVPFA